MSNVYSIQEVITMMDALSEVFDLARIVDPVKRHAILFDANNHMYYQPYECYKVWDKHEPCDNCISRKALYNKRRLNKYEFVNDDVFHVIAKYIQLIDEEGQTRECVIELVNKISSEVTCDTYGRSELIHSVIDGVYKVYIDSLTKAYNRRYYDERVFLEKAGLKYKKKVCFVITDLKRFKHINDCYGHSMGDKVLAMFAQTILGCIRQTDSLIRIGGDEFLIILPDCNIEGLKRVIYNIKERLPHSTIYNMEKKQYARANFGYSITDQFDGSDEMIQRMMLEADQSMYQDKNKPEAS